MRGHPIGARLPFAVCHGYVCGSAQIANATATFS